MHSVDAVKYSDHIHIVSYVFGDLIHVYWVQISRYFFCHDSCPDTPVVLSWIIHSFIHSLGWLAEISYVFRNVKIQNSWWYLTFLAKTEGQMSDECQNSFL
jgi:hypothetical protein